MSRRDCGVGGEGRAGGGLIAPALGRVLRGRNFNFARWRCLRRWVDFGVTSSQYGDPHDCLGSLKSDPTSTRLRTNGEFGWEGGFDIPRWAFRILQYALNLRGVAIANIRAIDIVLPHVSSDYPTYPLARLPAAGRREAGACAAGRGRGGRRGAALATPPSRLNRTRK